MDNVRDEQADIKPMIRGYITLMDFKCMLTVLIIYLESG